VTVVVYGTREVSTRVVVWFVPGILNVLVLVSILVLVTTDVTGILAVVRTKEVRRIVLVPFLRVIVLIKGEPEAVIKCEISTALVPLFSVTVLVSTEPIVLSRVAVMKCGILIVLVPFFAVTVLVSTEAIVLSTVTVVGSWEMLIPTEAIVLSTVTVDGAWERVKVLLPRFMTFVETMVWTAVEESPVLINVLPDEAQDVPF
jgi:hypothetical protein